MNDPLTITIRGDAADAFRENFRIDSAAQAAQSLRNADALFAAGEHPWSVQNKDIFDWAAKEVDRRYREGIYRDGELNLPRPIDDSSGNTVGELVELPSVDAVAPTADADLTPPEEDGFEQANEDEDEGEGEGGWKDTTRDVLGYAGWVPGLNVASAIGEAALDISDGDWVGAGISLLGVVPIAGKGLSKLGRWIRGSRRNRDTRVDRRRRDGDSNKNCKSCPSTARPVNPIYGCKILEGDEDLDFVLDGLLPLVWQRGYASDNPDSGWLGQGWTVPLSFRLDISSAGADFVDLQGRRIQFPDLGIGERFFSPYERIELHRSARNSFEITTGDGLRLCFAPAPSDTNRLAAKGAAQAQTAGNEGEDEALSRLLPPQVERMPLCRIIDRNDNWLQIHYTADDRPQVVETSGGKYAGFVFTELAQAGATPAVRLVQVLELLGQPDAEGRFAASRSLVEYRYSDQGDLIEVRDEQGQPVRQFQWQNHIMVAHSQPGGVTSSYEWDVLSPEGRALRNRVSTGEVLEFEYDLAQGISRVTDNSGRVRLWYFDADDRLIAETDAEGGHTVYELDSYGNRVRTIDPLGRVTRQRFDADSNLVEIEQADGGRWQIAYSPGRQPVAITDPTGAVTRHVYDARGNLVESVQPDGSSTRYVLDARGLPEQLIDALGGVYRFRFDAAGRLTERTDCLGQPTRYDYDDAGNLVRVIDALGGITQYRYQRINRRDRVVGITLPDGSSERFAYDALGRLIAHHDALGRATAWQLDADGRPLARVNALGHRLAYQYDRHGRLLSLTNENGALYRFAWDRADRLLAEQGLDGRRIDYRYNAAGELIETADGASPGAPWMAPGATGLVRTRLQRDAMGRLTDRICLLGRERSQHTRSRFEYDPAGRLLRARNTAARVELVYTPRGLLAAEVSRPRGGVEQRIEHAYDALGHRIATTLPDGRVLQVDRYGSGHVHRLRLDGDLLSEFERDGLHRETVRSQGALRSFFEHDPVGRLTSSRVRRGDVPAGGSTTGSSATDASPQPEPALARSYQYDAAGQLLRIDDRRSGVQVFRYDASSRLIAAQGPLGRELFAFDPASNLLDASLAQPDSAPSEGRTWTDEAWAAYVREHLQRPDFNAIERPADGPGPEQWQPMAHNRLAVWQQHRYTYDRFGNTIEKRSGAHERRRLHWNAEHQLCRIEVHTARGVEVWGYDYDPFGRRVAKYRLPAEYATREPAANDDPAPLPGEKRKRPVPLARAAYLARHAPETVHFGWEGNRLLSERSGSRQQLYLYEDDSFVPLMLVRSEVGTTGGTAAHGTADADAALNAALEADLDADSLAIKHQHPEHWELLQARRRKLARQLGQTAAPAPRPKAEVIHLHTDHLGTPKEATDVDGHLVWTADYAAWGKARTATPPRRILATVGNTVTETLEEQTDPVECNLRFQGQYFDAESGLHYNRFRYYDPDVGRFVSQDPIGLAGGENLYQYAPNPILWTDPHGLKSTYVRNWERANGQQLPDGYKVHHIIPQSLVNEAKAVCKGFNVHDSSNLIALPGRAGVQPASGSGFGSTNHFGAHAGYNEAVRAALVAARRLNSPGLNGCMKIAAIQQMLKASLQSGQIPLSNGRGGNLGVTSNWINYLRQQARGG